MINCPKCGRELPDDAVFCASCGAKIVIPEPPAAPQPVIPEPEPVPAEPEPAPVEVKPEPEEPRRASRLKEEPVEAAPVTVKEEAEKPAPAKKKRKKGSELEPPSGAAALAAVGFASAFFAPFAAIILCALAKKKCGREFRRSTYSKLAGWGLFFGIIFTLGVVLYAVGYFWYGNQFLNKLVHYIASVINTYLR